MYSWLLLIIYKYQPNSFLAPVVHFSNGWDRSNWNIIDFPCLVGKMANTTLRFKAKNKAFIYCSVWLSTSRKRSSSTKVKISLNIHSSKSSKSSHWSSSILQTIFCPGRERQNLPKEMRWEISSASPRYIWNNKQINQIYLHVCKNFNQSTPKGQILTVLSAWKWDSPLHDSLPLLQRKFLRKNLWD